MEGATYMEIGLHEWELAYRNAHIRVRSWVLELGPPITKNGYIGEVTEIKSSTRRHRESTNPCSVEPDRQRLRQAGRSQ